MRLISQNGIYDVPYEQGVIKQFDTYICFLSTSLTENLKLAVYSTRQKASKAMEMLHEEYKQYSYATNNNDFYLFFNQPKMFKFPQDNEV